MTVIAPRRGFFGKLPAPAHIAAANRGYRGGTGLAGSVINSTGPIAAGSLTGMGAMGNLTYENCCSAALGHHKQIITAATGGTMLFLPEGGNPPSSDTDWSSASAVPANSPGVVAWSQANNCLGYTTITAVLNSLMAAGTWPAGGFVDSSLGHHPILSHGPITPANQTQVISALGYFKTVIFGLSGDQMLSQWSGGNRFFHGLTANADDNHAFTVCDCGPASTLATQYGVSVPSGISTSAFCIGGITWGDFCVMDWASLLNVVTEAHVIIADPDRHDAATWNPTAQCYYRSVIGTNGPFLAAALCSYRK